jgi:hypothetical protein
MATADDTVVADAVADDSNTVASAAPTLSVGAIVGIVLAVLAVAIIAVLVVIKSRAPATTPSADDYRKM